MPEHLSVSLFSFTPKYSRTLGNVIITYLKGGRMQELGPGLLLPCRNEGVLFILGILKKKAHKSVNAKLYSEQSILMYSI